MSAKIVKNTRLGINGRFFIQVPLMFIVLKIQSQLRNIAENTNKDSDVTHGCCAVILTKQSCSPSVDWAVANNDMIFLELPNGLASQVQRS